MTLRTVTVASLWLLTALAVDSAAVQNRPAIDITGAWVMTVEMSMGTASPTIDIKQDGEKLSGIYVSRYGDYPLTGTLKGRVISFSFTMRPEDPMTITYTGEVASDGRSMKGKGDLGEMGEATWSAERARK